MASRDGRAAIAQLLADKGARLDLVSKNGYSALMCASYKGHAAIAQLLATRMGAVALNLVDNDGMTALSWAEQGGDNRDKAAELAPAAAAIRARGGLTGAALKARR